MKYISKSKRLLIVHVCLFLILVTTLRPETSIGEDRLWSQAVVHPFSIKNLPYDQLPWTFERVTVNLPFPEDRVDNDGVPVLYRTDLDGVTRPYYHPVSNAFITLQLIDSYAVSRNIAYLDTAELIAEKMVSETDEIDGVILFPYKFGYKAYGRSETTLQAPWYSGMAQGLWLSVFVRLYNFTDDVSYLNIADRIFESFDKDPGDGPWVSTLDEQGYYWIEEYPLEPLDHTLNGFLFAITLGLYDYYVVDPDAEKKKVLQAAITTVHHYVSQYRTVDEISLYSLNSLVPGIRSVGYHLVHMDLLNILYDITGDVYFSNMAVHLYHDMVGRTEVKAGDFDKVPQLENEFKGDLPILGFDGSVSFQTDTQGLLDYPAGSIAFWFSPQWNSTDKRHHYILDTRNETSDANLYLYYDYLENTFTWPGSTSSDLSFDSDEWLHIMLVWNSSQSTVYVNGKEIGRGKPISVGSLLQLGSKHTNNYHCGCKLSHFLIVERPFDIDEIALVYQVSLRELLDFSVYTPMIQR